MLPVGVACFRRERKRRALIFFCSSCSRSSDADHLDPQRRRRGRGRGDPAAGERDDEALAESVGGGLGDPGRWNKVFFLEKRRRLRDGRAGVFILFSLLSLFDSLTLKKERTKQKENKLLLRTSTRSRARARTS